MQLTSPIIITARLLAGVKIGNGIISIEYADRAGDGHRVRYQYHIDTPDFEHSDDDLQSGCQHSLQNSLESLLSFLGAAAESYQYEMSHPGCSDNSDLFPANVTEWAYQHSDEIGCLTCELEETPNLINEGN